MIRGIHDHPSESCVELGLSVVDLGEEREEGVRETYTGCAQRHSVGRVPQCLQHTVQGGLRVRIAVRLVFMLALHLHLHHVIALIAYAKSSCQEKKESWGRDTPPALKNRMRIYRLLVQ